MGFVTVACPSRPIVPFRDSPVPASAAVRRASRPSSGIRWTSASAREGVPVGRNRDGRRCHRLRESWPARSCREAPNLPPGWHRPPLRRRLEGGPRCSPRGKRQTPFRFCPFIVVSSKISTTGCNDASSRGSSRHPSDLRLARFNRLVRPHFGLSSRLRTIGCPHARGKRRRD